MGIVYFIIVMYAIILKIKDYESWDKKVDRLDRNPYNSVKSDRWLRNHH